MTALPYSPEVNEADQSGGAGDERPAQWDVIHTDSGYERKVKKNLENRIESMGMSDKIFDVVLPVDNETEIHNGQRRPA